MPVNNLKESDLKNMGDNNTVIQLGRNNNIRNEKKVDKKIRKKGIKQYVKEWKRVVALFMMRINGVSRY